MKPLFVLLATPHVLILELNQIHLIENVLLLLVEPVVLDPSLLVDWCSKKKVIWRERERERESISWWEKKDKLKY